MFSRLSKKSAVKRILVVSMTNIGDVVLSCPAIDVLRRDFPEARMDVMVGPKAISLFEANPYIRARVFDKRAPWPEAMAWFLDLRRQDYDCVVDLRHTMLALFLMPRYSTPLWLGPQAGHKRDIHLNRLRQVYGFDAPSGQRFAVVTTQEDEKFFLTTVAPDLNGQTYVVIAPGAASAEKRWHSQGFAAVADRLSSIYRIVFVGDDKDVPIVRDIQAAMKSPSLSLAGRIHLRQLAYVLKQSAFALVHDSGVMHLASYLNVPVVALWGPTDVGHYAPWSAKSAVVRRHEQCPRCQDPKSREKHTCMSLIQVEDVIRTVEHFQKLP